MNDLRGDAGHDFARGREASRVAVRLTLVPRRPKAGDHDHDLLGATLGGDGTWETLTYSKYA